MKEFWNSYKNPILGAILVIVLAAAWWYFWGNQGSDEAVLSETETSGFEVAQVRGSEVISLLETLRSLKLDTEVLKDPNFAILKDLELPISPEAAGRNNPFAPI